MLTSSSGVHVRSRRSVDECISGWCTFRALLMRGRLTLDTVEGLAKVCAARRVVVTVITFN